MWNNIAKGDIHPLQNGTVHIKLAQPGAVYSADKDGKNQVLLGTGTLIKVKGINAEAIMTTANGQIFEPAKPTVYCHGAPFTNAEKRQGYSAEHAAVTLALRQLNIERAAHRLQMKIEFDELQRKRKRLGLQSEAPAKPEPPVVVPDPDPSTDDQAAT